MPGKITPAPVRPERMNPARKTNPGPKPNLAKVHRRQVPPGKARQKRRRRKQAHLKKVSPGKALLKPPRRGLCPTPVRASRRPAPNPLNTKMLPARVSRKARRRVLRSRKRRARLQRVCRKKNVSQNKVGDIRPPFAVRGTNPSQFLPQVHAALAVLTPRNGVSRDGSILCTEVQLRACAEILCYNFLQRSGAPRSTR